MLAQGSGCMLPKSFRRECRVLAHRYQYPMEKCKMTVFSYGKSIACVSCETFAFFSLQKLCFVYLSSQLKNVTFYIKCICIFGGAGMWSSLSVRRMRLMSVTGISPDGTPFLQMKLCLSHWETHQHRQLQGQPSWSRRGRSAGPFLPGQPPSPAWDHPRPHGWHLKTTADIGAKSFFQIWLI